MKRSILAIAFLLSCARPPAPAPVPMASQPLGAGTVTATALNVRAEATADSEILTTLRRGASLTLVEERSGWYRVRLASGDGGWVSAQYVSRGGAPAVRRAGGCPPDSDYAFEKSPIPSFSDRGSHGLVTIEANVNASGDPISTRVLSNTTGDPALAALAEQEIRSAKFIPPIRNCVRRAFIFTYKRAF